MRIGLLMSHTDPRGGGGYTFENEILRSLGALAQESRHKFIVFTDEPILEANQGCLTTPDGLVHVKMPNRLIRTSHRFLYKAFRKIPTRLCPYWRSNVLDSYAKKHGIQFFLFFEATHIPSDIPYAVIAWDIEHRSQPWFPELSQKGIWDSRELVHSKLLRRATYIVTGTEIGREQVEFFYRVPRERIKILPHPTPFIKESDLIPNRISLFEKYGLKENFLLYPSNFWPHKNHANLLMALKYMRENLNLSLTMVFTGNDVGNESYIRQLSSELGLNEHVRFLGFTAHQELVALYKNAFALAYLSFGGPENMPPLEGFSLGCPVIAADIPGAREQLADSALLVDPQNPKQIAEAVEKLYDDPQLRETLITKGKNRARRFTGHDFVRGLFSIFDEFEPIRRCWPAI
jgi:glycosyltransferase involved in cell wall biosynthesis